jgi:hypothetical protein
MIWLLAPPARLLAAALAAFAFSSGYASEPPSQSLKVNGAWLDGETLRVEVSDEGREYALDLRLGDHEAGNAEFIEIQAVDLEGNASEIFELPNPRHDPEKAATASGAQLAAQTGEKPAGGQSAPDAQDRQAASDETEAQGASDPPAAGQAGESGSKPLTPDGGGTVLDNVSESDGKEIFTFESDGGNAFFLIVDRQKPDNNVFLLNPVTEDDLRALAEKAEKADAPQATAPPAADRTETPPFFGQLGQQEAPAQTAEATQEPEGDDAPQEAEEPPEAPQQAPAEKSWAGAFIAIALTAAAAGGAGWYLKIYRPKKEAPDPYEEDDDGEEFGADGPEDEGHGSAGLDGEGIGGPDDEDLYDEYGMEEDDD